MGWIKHWQQRRRLAKQSWHSVPWVAIDCESNGLDPTKDALLSLAWVPVEPPFVRIGATQYAVIESQLPLSQSAVVHQLTSTELRQGEPLVPVLERFAEATAGAYIIAHYAEFDRRLLQQAMQQAGVVWQPAGWYDTLAVEKRYAAEQTSLATTAFSLSACRSRYGLLGVHEHHARNDAIACAELFLAQVYGQQNKHNLPAKSLSLGQVLRRSR